MLENLIVSTVSPVVNLIPEINLTNIFSHPGVQTFIDILCAVSYFFPWDTVITIVTLIAGLQAFRLVVAFFKALWGVIPVV